MPQRFILGLFLFLALINDIDGKVKYFLVKTLAEDTRVTAPIGTLDDTALLKKDFNAIFSRTYNNNMKFNESKCELLRYSINSHLDAGTAY